MQPTVGRYPVSGVLGQGGFGVVYLGTDPDDGALVAVKTMHAVQANPQRYAALREQLAAEAGAMVALHSPFCVRVRDVFELPELAAVVSDYVPGANLRGVLRTADRLTGPQALGVCAGALSGLHDLHALGLVHGDLKPDNVLVDESGRSLLNDFGLVSPPRAGAPGGSASGTPAYMAPEMFTAGITDVRTDLYACAVMLYEVLAGRRPFVDCGDERAWAQTHLHAPAPWLLETVPEAGERLARLVARNLEKDPARRDQSAAEFVAELRVAAGESFGPRWGAAAGLGGVVGAAIAASTGVLPLGAAGSAAGLFAASGGAGSAAAGFAGGGSMTSGTSGAVAGAGTGSMTGATGSMGASASGSMTAGASGSMTGVSGSMTAGTATTGPMFSGTTAGLSVGTKVGIGAAAVTAVIAGGAVVVPLVTSDAPVEVVEVYPYDTDGELLDGWTLIDYDAAGGEIDSCWASNGNSEEAGEFYDCGASADYSFSCWPTPNVTDSVTCPVNLPDQELVRWDGVELSGEVTEPLEEPWPIVIELEDGSIWRIREGGSWDARSDNAVGTYACDEQCTNDDVLLQLADGQGIVRDDDGWYTWRGELGDPEEDFPAPEKAPIATVWFAAAAPES